MCGILGYLTLEKHTLVADRQKFIRQGLIIDTLRGEDSTGIFYAERDDWDKSAAYYKAAEDGYSFVNRKPFMDVMTKASTLAFVVGHNRAATVGTINADTAHPFREGSVTGVHNGTLTSTYSLPKSQRELGAEVDSHALIHNISLVEPSAVDTEVLAKINGSYALVWHDSRDQSLNFARNGDRPLTFGVGGRTLYWMSEPAMLAMLNKRLVLGIKEMYSLDTFTHVKFKQDSLVPEVATYTQQYAGWSYPAKSSARQGTYYQSSDSQGSASGQTAAEELRTRRAARYVGGTDNRVTVSGKKRPVPEALQDALRDLGMCVEDRIMFTPLEKYLPTKGGRAEVSVQGHLDTLGLPALIHGLSGTAADQHFNSRWCVRPVGVHKIGEEPIVTCILVGITLNYENIKSRPGIRPVPTLAPQQSVTGGSVSLPGSGRAPASLPAPLVYPAGGGLYVSRQTWMDMTEDGCMSCQCPVALHEADWLEWHDGQPLCMQCINEERNAVVNSVPGENSLPWPAAFWND